MCAQSADAICEVFMHSLHSSDDVMHTEILNLMNNGSLSQDNRGFP